MISTCKYFNCPICMSSKREKNSTKCKKCKSTHICNECMLQMCEKGMADKCPICRQTEWRKQKLKIFSILPNNNTTRVINTIRIVDERGNVVGDHEIKGCLCYCSCYCFRNVVHTIVSVFAYISLSWFCGFLVIVTLANDFRPNDPKHATLLSWLPFVIGFPCLTLLICWCGRCICEQKFERPVQDFMELTCCHH